MKLHNLILSALLCLTPFVVNAAEDSGTPKRVRSAVFSTTSDWEALTGLRFTEYKFKFIPDSKLVNDGLELYSLDSFPCIGHLDRPRVWIGPNKKTSGEIGTSCLYLPEVVRFAWRNTKRDSTQTRTTGILECPIDKSTGFEIDLSKCTIGPEWKDINF